jgi:hypothetical protein
VIVRNLIAIALFVGVPLAIHSQTSAYQSADGTSAIFLNNAKANLVLNVSDSKFNVGYLIEQAARSPEFGIHFSGKPNSDVTAQIFQSANSPAEIDGGGSLGWHGIFFPGAGQAKPTDHLRDDWGLVDITYTRSTFDTVATASTTAVAQHFNGFTILPTYDALFNFPGINFLMGLAAGVNRTNNVSSLKSVEVTTTETQGSTISVVQQQSAYLGNYTTAIGAPVYSDFVVIPKKTDWLSFDAFERSNVATANRYAEGGLGLFLSKPSAPTQVLGGISLGWKDGKRTVALVGGWSF